MFALGRMEIRSSFILIYEIVIRGRCADFQGVIFSIRISIKIYGYSRMMRFDISHDINGRKIMDVYLWGMFLPGKINITIYLWKVRIDGWKLGSPPPLFLSPRLRISNFRDIYIYIPRAWRIRHPRGSNPEGSISDKKRASPLHPRLQVSDYFVSLNPSWPIANYVVSF